MDYFNQYNEQRFLTEKDRGKVSIGQNLTNYITYETDKFFQDFIRTGLVFIKDENLYDFPSNLSRPERKQKIRENKQLWAERLGKANKEACDKIAETIKNKDYNQDFEELIWYQQFLADRDLKSIYVYHARLYDKLFLEGSPFKKWRGCLKELVESLQDFDLIPWDDDVNTDIFMEFVKYHPDLKSEYDIAFFGLTN